MFLFFISSLIIALLNPPEFLLMIIGLINLSYLLTLFLESLRACLKRRLSLASLATALPMMINLFLIHLSYGAGGTYGLLREFILAPISDLFKSPGQETVSERA